MKRTLEFLGRHAGLLIVLVAAYFPRFHQLGGNGFGCPSSSGNVRSMMQSWWHFFFVAWDPQGTYMFDKPPLGFWFQTLSAHLFGYDGFALMLPQAIAGMVSVALVYRLILLLDGNRIAATCSAGILAFMPNAVLVARSNKVDALLPMFVLIAACCLAAYLKHGKFSRIWLAAFFCGLAFNVKGLAMSVMMPSLVLLAVYGMPWRKPKLLLNYIPPLLFFLVLAFGWIVAVDMTPEDQRPRVMNTDGNRMLELTLAHNGLARMSNDTGFRPATILTSTGIEIAEGVLYGGLNGWKRLFGEFPGSMISYLLPLVLVGIVLSFANANRKALPVAASFWFAWLLLGLLAFSFSRMAPPHYLELMATPYAVFAGIGLAGIGSDKRRTRFLALAGIYGSVLWMLFTLVKLDTVGDWLAPACIMVIAASTCLIYRSIQERPLAKNTLVFGSMAVLLSILFNVSWICVKARQSEGVIPGAIFLELKRKGELNPSYSATANAYIAGRVSGLQHIYEYMMEKEPDTRYLAAMPTMNGCSLIATHFNRSAIPYYNEYLNRYERSGDELSEMVKRGEFRFMMVTRGRLRSMNEAMKQFLETGENISEQLGFPPDHHWSIYDFKSHMPAGGSN
ncbi:MAG TPA: glycosyltransferase family 39 protein [Kiritimatiellia bacterium]|nr:glycosyltransferase family 39 protein [Kiritimatiellia bacterium]